MVNREIFRPRTVEPNFSPPVYGLAEMRVRVYVSITNPAPCKWPFKFTGPSATQGVTSLIELVPVWPAERERDRARLIRLSENFECPGNFALSPQTFYRPPRRFSTILSLYIYIFFFLLYFRREGIEKRDAEGKESRWICI